MLRPRYQRIINKHESVGSVLGSVLSLAVPSGLEAAIEKLPDKVISKDEVLSLRKLAEFLTQHGKELAGSGSGSDKAGCDGVPALRK